VPSQVLSSVEQNFTKGLVTEFTGLNFPENAATDADNCVFTLIGDVNRRLGMDLEEGYAISTFNRTDLAMSDFLWNNAGGDGTTKLFVNQIGGTLQFYNAGTATNVSGLSAQRLLSEVNLDDFKVVSLDSSLECEYATGNGFLFVYHPSCQPFFCSFASSTVTATVIEVKVRDFNGVLETGNPAVTDRPTTLTDEHLYNLINQGWTQGSPWQITSVSSPPTVVASGSTAFTVPSGVTGTTIGDQVSIITTQDFYTGSGFIAAGTPVMAGVLQSYVGTTMTINITGDLLMARGSQLGPYRIVPYNKGYINTWQAGLGNYPSNADVWWYFKNSSNTFDPVTTLNQVTVNSGNAPRGHFILDAFNQNKSTVSAVSNITPVTTDVRPRTGAWFQGRVWYTGVDASQTKTGDADFYSWSSNIYFSQVVKGPEQFGACHQLNDPTSETLFDLLPTDGGVITIQEAGAIYKLFPIQNGMLVFADNGIWFITGSQGIGFPANDYTITKISSIRALSAMSFVDVLGLPYFWNHEGIYSVKPAQQGGLTVTPVTVDTISSFYEEIPLSSKKYARGDYDPVNYIIQWVYKDTEAVDTTDRYTYNKVLNFNTHNGAFFPYTVDTTSASINGIRYVNFSGGLDKPLPAMKFVCSFSFSGSYGITFAEEISTDYEDWSSTPLEGVNFDSYFVTGYKLHGQAQRRFQIPYIYMFSRAAEATAYKIQSIWDYATSGNSGKWSSLQTTYNNKPYFGMIFRRHRLRGQGLVLQIKVTSVDGYPFDIMGWSSYENANAGV
jgi:hypothetical protein